MNSDYDNWLDDELERYYYEDEDFARDEDSDIDVYIEDKESEYDGY